MIGLSLLRRISGDSKVIHRIRRLILACRRIGGISLLRFRAERLEIVFYRRAGKAQRFPVRDFLHVVQTDSDTLILRVVIPEEGNPDIGVHAGIDAGRIQDILKVSINHLWPYVAACREYPAAPALRSERLSVGRPDAVSVVNAVLGLCGKRGSVFHPRGFRCGTNRRVDFRFVVLGGFGNENRSAITLFVAPRAAPGFG